MKWLMSTERFIEDIWANLASPFHRSILKQKEDQPKKKDDKNDQTDWVGWVNLNIAVYPIIKNVIAMSKKNRDRDIQHPWL